MADSIIDRLRQAHLDESCPFCEAKPSNKCRTPTGRTMSKPHADRIYNGNLLYYERVDSGHYNKPEVFP